MHVFWYISNLASMQLFEEKWEEVGTRFLYSKTTQHNHNWSSMLFPLGCMILTAITKVIVLNILEI